jgi:phosphoglycerate kinase
MKSINQAFPQYANQTAIVRANFDVPLENGQVQDTTRIEDCVNTIKILQENHCRIVLLAHAGRPEGAFDQDSSLKPVGEVLASLLHQPVTLVPYQADYSKMSIPADPIVLIENLRFWSQEEANDPEFASYLASLGNFYVNEAFAVCHRKHASIVGIPTKIPSFAGVSLAKEITALSKVRVSPERPLVVVIGGAKLETKMPLVEAFAPTADQVLVGGKVAAELKDKPVASNVVLANLNPDGKDITKESATQFADIIMQAKTVVLNGTMGMFEDPDHELGTKIVATAVNQSPAYTMIGGGDTESSMTKYGTEAGIDHISTGGGAMLTFIIDGKLDGVEALT